MSKSKATLALNLVAFVDVLGFTERVLSIKSAKSLEALDNDVRAVQRHFDVNPDDPRIRESQEITEKQVLAFSDCIVLRASLNSDLITTQGSFDTLMGEVFSLAASQGACIADGIFVRGALDFGFWSHTDNRLISPALARAYKLEREAVVPVIRLSDSAIKFFRAHSHRYFYAKDADPFDSSFLSYSDTVTGQQFWFIDYMNLVINNLDWRVSRKTHDEYFATEPDERGQVIDRGYQENLRRWLNMHHDAILTGYKKSKDARVQLKYRWLAKYHNRTVDQYKPELGALRFTASQIATLGRRYQIDTPPKRRNTKARILAMLKEQERLAAQR
jgi:hypothetical protein